MKKSTFPCLASFLFFGSLFGIFGFIGLHPTVSLSSDFDSELTGKFADITLMNRNSDALRMKRSLIQGAEKQIDLSYFIIEDDPTSTLIFKDLLNKSKNPPVRIRILVDYFMSQLQVSALLMLNADPNIEVKRFRPPSEELIRQLNHLKINPKAFILGLIFQNKEMLALAFKDTHVAHLISGHEKTGHWDLGDIFAIMVKIFKEMADPDLEKEVKTFLMRTHHKLMVIDRQKFVMGGRNISDEYHVDVDDPLLINNPLLEKRDYAFQDTDVSGIEIAGNTQQQAFDRLWSSPLSVPVDQAYVDERFDNQDSILPQPMTEMDLEKKVLLAKDFSELGLSEKVFRVEKEKVLPGILVENTGFTQPENKSITKAYADLIHSAKKQIDIVTAYFYVDPETGDGALTRIYEELLAATSPKRNVKVRIYTNSPMTTDLKIVNRMAYSNYEALRQAGVQIFELDPKQGSLHTKTMAVDNEILAVGSFNLDARSHSFDSNNVLILKDESGALVQAFRRERVERLNWSAPDPERMEKFMEEFLNINKYKDILSIKLLKRMI